MCRIHSAYHEHIFFRSLNLSFQQQNSNKSTIVSMFARISDLDVNYRLTIPYSGKMLSIWRTRSRQSREKDFIRIAFWSFFSTGITQLWRKTRWRTGKSPGPASLCCWITKLRKLKLCLPSTLIAFMSKQAVVLFSSWYVIAWWAISIPLHSDEVR